MFNKKRKTFKEISSNLAFSLIALGTYWAVLWWKSEAGITSIPFITVVFLHIAGFYFNGGIGQNIDLKYDFRNLAGMIIVTVLSLTAPFYLAIPAEPADWVLLLYVLLLVAQFAMLIFYIKLKKIEIDYSATISWDSKDNEKIIKPFKLFNEKKDKADTAELISEIKKVNPDIFDKTWVPQPHIKLFRKVSVEEKLSELFTGLYSVKRKEMRIKLSTTGAKRIELYVFLQWGLIPLIESLGGKKVQVLLENDEGASRIRSIDNQEK